MGCSGTNINTIKSPWSGSERNESVRANGIMFERMGSMGSCSSEWDRAKSCGGMISLDQNYDVVRSSIGSSSNNNASKREREFNDRESVSFAFPRNLQVALLSFLYS